MHLDDYHRHHAIKPKLRLVLVEGNIGIPARGAPRIEKSILVDKFSLCVGAGKKTYVRVYTWHFLMRWHTVFLCASRNKLA